jgi:hypothetical protein
MVRKSRTPSTHKPDPQAPPRKGRHFLRAAVAPKTTIQVGEPVRVQAKLRTCTPDEVTAQIAGAIGVDRYVSFDSPGSHTVPLVIVSRLRALT